MECTRCGKTTEHVCPGCKVRPVCFGCMPKDYRKRRLCESCWDDIDFATRRAFIPSCLGMIKYGMVALLLALAAPVSADNPNERERDGRKRSELSAANQRTIGQRDEDAVGETAVHPSLGEANRLPYASPFGILGGGWIARQEARPLIRNATDSDGSVLQGYSVPHDDDEVEWLEFYLMEIPLDDRSDDRSCDHLNERYYPLGRIPAKHDDGSSVTRWAVKLPANVPIGMATLDGDGRVLSWSATWKKVAPGAVYDKGCVGCHVHTREAVQPLLGSIEQPLPSVIPLLDGKGDVHIESASATSYRLGGPGSRTPGSLGVRASAKAADGWARGDLLSAPPMHQVPTERHLGITAKRVKGASDARSLPEEGTASTAGMAVLQLPRVSVAPEWNRDVRPIWLEHCAHCHESDTPADPGAPPIRLSEHFAGTGGGSLGLPPRKVGIPHKARISSLYTRLTTDDLSQRMPKDGDPLSPEQIELVGRWIDLGMQVDGDQDGFADTTPPSVTLRVRDGLVHAGAWDLHDLDVTVTRDGEPVTLTQASRDVWTAPLVAGEWRVEASDGSNTTSLVRTLSGDVPDPPNEHDHADEIAALEAAERKAAEAQRALDELTAWIRAARESLERE